MVSVVPKLCPELVMFAMMLWLTPAGRAGVAPSTGLKSVFPGFWTFSRVVPPPTSPGVMAQPPPETNVMLKSAVSSHVDPAPTAPFTMRMSVVGAPAGSTDRSNEKMKWSP